jgi:general secretion pathway protein D
VNSGNIKSVILGVVLGGGVIAAVFLNKGPTPVQAQNRSASTGVVQAAREAPAVPVSASTNTPPAEPAAATPGTNTLAAPKPAASGPANAAPSTNVVAAVVSTNAPPGISTNAPSGAAVAGSSTNAPENEDIQLSFQGANIDMITQWLAKTTGKSVVKHPRVQCQLTIMSSKKLPPRDAINLVYRALGLEGFSVLETSKSITVFPDGQEPKVSPELVENDAAVPEGRQRLVKFFTLKHAEPAEIKDKIKTVLSDKATVEVADRSNQLIVTDWGENIKMLGDLIKELDVPSGSDSAIQFFSLKYSDAEELGNLLLLVLNAQPAPPRSPSSSSGPSPRSIPGMPPGMMMSSPSPSPSGSPSSGASGGGNGVFKIWPDKTANRLIVAAPKSRMDEVQRLIDLMDTEKQLDYSIRTLPLKNVSAEDLVREIQPLYQKMASKGKDNVEVTANVRSNSLIVMSSESQFKALQKLIGSLDTEDAQEKVMQAFTLKNAEADDVAKQLMDLNEDQDSNNRSPYFFYSFSSMNQKSGKKINVVADKRRNSVMVQAPPNQMESIAKLVAELDEPITDDSLAPKIYRLKYVSAVDIEDVINELFLKKEQQQQRYYWDPYNDSDSNSRDSKGGRLYGKVRIISEPYSNSILVSGNSPESISAVEEVLKQLDQPSEAGESTFKVALDFAQATTVATSLNVLFAKPGSPPFRNNPQPANQAANNPQFQQPNGANQNVFQLEQEVRDESYYPWLGGPQENNVRGADGRNTSRPVSDLVGRVRVVPDRRSNALLVTCNLHFFPQVMKLINELDAPTSQVLLQAKIIEVSSDFRDRLGVRWSPDGSRAFDSDDLDNSFRVKTGVSYKDTFGGKLADSLHTGLLDSSINVDFLIQFLRKNTGSKVLAEPQLNIRDNELGRLFVGAQVPFISNSLNTDVGGRSDSFTYKDVGIILEVTPHINNSEQVALKIRTESSNIRNGETLFGGFIIDTRNFRTDVMVKNGETIVLGGIIQREQADTTRQVPFLGSIPGLGWAFKKRDKTSREVELMVFLTPRVTRSPEQARELLKSVRERAPLIQNWQEESESLKLPKDAQPKDLMPKNAD